MQALRRRKFLFVFKELRHRKSFHNDSPGMRFMHLYNNTLCNCGSNIYRVCSGCFTRKASRRMLIEIRKEE